MVCAMFLLLLFFKAGIECATGWPGWKCHTYLALKSATGFLQTLQAVFIFIFKCMPEKL